MAVHSLPVNQVFAKVEPGAYTEEAIEASLRTQHSEDANNAAGHSMNGHTNGHTNGHANGHETDGLAAPNGVKTDGLLKVGQFSPHGPQRS